MANVPTATLNAGDSTPKVTRASLILVTEAVNELYSILDPDTDSAVLASARPIVVTGGAAFQGGTVRSAAFSGVYPGVDPAGHADLTLADLTQAANSRISRLYTTGGGSINLGFSTDDFASVTAFLKADRSANTTTLLTLTATQINLVGPVVVSGSVSATSFSGAGSALTTLNASNLSSGTVATARLGTGTANSTTILYGDGTWKVAPSGGGGTATALAATASLPSVSATASGVYIGVDTTTVTIPREFWVNSAATANHRIWGASVSNSGVWTLANYDDTTALVTTFLTLNGNTQDAVTAVVSSNGFSFSPPAPVSATAAGANVNISAMAGGSTSGTGGQIVLTGGAVNTASTAGSVSLNGGANSSTGTAGSATLKGGASTSGQAGAALVTGGNGAAGGGVTITAGTGTAGAGGAVSIFGGGSSTSGGSVSMQGGGGTASAPGGSMGVYGGSAGATAGDTGAVVIASQAVASGSTGNSGTVNVNTGAIANTGGSAASGSLTLQTGSIAGGSGSSGQIFFTTGAIAAGGTGAAGAIQLRTGFGQAGGNGGSIILQTGPNNLASAGNTVGQISIATGTANGTSAGSGNISVTTGDAVAASGSLNIQTGVSQVGGGGAINITAGAQSSASGQAGTITLTSGACTTANGGLGAQIQLTGAGQISTLLPGRVIITAGTGVNAAGGGVTISGGSYSAAGVSGGGGVTLSGGTNTNASSNAVGAGVTLNGANAQGNGTGGGHQITGGNSPGSGNAGGLTVTCGNNSGTANGGSITLTAGNATGTSGTGGSLNFQTGSGTTAPGGVTFGVGGTNRLFIVAATSVALQPAADNTLTCGAPTARFSVVYAGTGTINTSDETTKTDLLDMSEAEARVAQRAKKLLRKYKFKDAVADKGDDKARWHFGIGAQSLMMAFEAEGLDAHDYGMFCRDSWYEVDGQAMDRDLKAYSAHDDGAYLVVRYGVRYDELLAFIVAAL